MKKLTKKYRLIWDEKGEMISDPYEEFNANTETIVGKGRGSFESDNIKDIEQKIQTEKLNYNENTNTIA